jgi:hypothetical protein
MAGAYICVYRLLHKSCTTSVVLSLSVCLVVVLYGAQQLCYLFFMCSWWDRLLSALVSQGIDVLHKWVNSADNFSYTCGEITFASKKRALTSVVKWAYLKYFKSRLPGPELGCAPMLLVFSSKLNGWVNHRWSLLLAVPMVWRELKNHLADHATSVWCPPILKGITKKKNRQWSMQI